MPFQLIATEIDCAFESADFKTAQISFGTPAINVDTTKPLRLKIIGNEQQWDVSLQGSMLEPLSASIALDGSFLPGDDGAKGFGSMSIRVTGTTTTLGSAINLSLSRAIRSCTEIFRSISPLVHGRRKLKVQPAKRI